MSENHEEYRMKTLDQLDEKINLLIEEVEENFEDELKETFSSCDSIKVLELLLEKSIIDVHELKEVLCDLIKSQREIYFTEEQIIQIKDIDVNYSITLELPAQFSDYQMLNIIKKGNFKVIQNNTDNNDNDNNKIFRSDFFKNIIIELDDQEKIDKMKLSLNIRLTYEK